MYKLIIISIKIKKIELIYFWTEDWKILFRSADMFICSFGNR